MKTPSKFLRSDGWLLCLLALFFFAIPIEHKYDKVFRFYSLTLIPSGLDVPSQFDKKIYFYCSDLFALFLFGMGLLRSRFKLGEPRSLFLLIVFGCAISSVIASPFAHYPVAYTRLLQLFTPVALFLFFAYCSISKERLFRLFSWSLFSTGVVQAILALWQYFSQRSLGLRFFNEQPLCAFIPGHERWIFDHWFPRSTEAAAGIFRAMGTLPHPNVLGGLLALSLLLTGYLFYSHSAWRRWTGAAYVLQFLALGTTYSRSALFAYLLGTILWVFWIWKREKTGFKSTLLLILLSACLTGSLFHRQYVDRGGIVNYNQFVKNSDQERLFYQRSALQLIQKAPWTGVGYGQFSLRSELPATGAVHNIYLLLAAETGLCSLAAFLAWIGLLLWRAWYSLSRETALLSAAFLAFLFIGCCDFYPLFFQQGKILFFSLAGLLAKWTRRDLPTRFVVSMD